MNKKTLLKVLALVLTAAVAFTVVHFAVLGNNTPVDTTFTFALEDGNAILTGASDPLSGAVVLPDTLSGHPVTGIGDDAFKDCADVTAFFLPQTVTSIGSYAFENCTSLAQVILPEDLTEIGEGAFWKCSNLVSMSIPAGVTKIGSCAFYKCSSLGSVIIHGAATPAKGIFNVALDVGQTLAVHNPARNILDSVNTTLYCYAGSVAYYDTIQDMYSNYALLDDSTRTAYTVRYIDESGAEVSPACTVADQPAGIRVAAVAIPVDDDTLQYPAEPTQTVTLSESENIITFVYTAVPETTTETTTEPTTAEETTTEPTTAEETTVEETTTEETTAEETTVEETTAEPTTVEETTSEPTTTVEPTTEEASTEPVRIPPTLSAKEGSGAVLDRELGYVYGLELNLTQETLASKYLQLTGEGHLEYSETLLGTGSTVTLINDIDGSVVETFTVILFGDLNGDSEINSSDMTVLKGMIVGSILQSDDPAAFYAADLAMDGAINATDRPSMLSIICGAAEYNQSTRELVSL